MKKIIPVLLVVIVLCSCSNPYQYNGWKTLDVEDVGTLKLPAEWTYYYEDGLLYIVDENESLIATQSKSYGGWSGDAHNSGIVESNSFFDEVQQICCLQATTVSTGTAYGTAKMIADGNESENYFLIYFGEPTFQMVFWDETVSEDLIAKIAWSFNSAG